MLFKIIQSNLKLIVCLGNYQWHGISHSQVAIKYTNRLN